MRLWRDTSGTAYCYDERIVSETSEPDNSSSGWLQRLQGNVVLSRVLEWPLNGNSSTSMWEGWVRKWENLLCKTNSERNLSKWHSKNIALFLNDVLKMQKAGSACFLHRSFSLNTSGTFPQAPAPSPSLLLPSGKKRPKQTVGHFDWKQFQQSDGNKWDSRVRSSRTCKRANVQFGDSRNDGVCG